MFTNCIHLEENHKIEIDNCILERSGAYEISIYLKGVGTTNRITLFMTKEQFEQTKQTFKEWSKCD